MMVTLLSLVKPDPLAVAIKEVALEVVIKEVALEVVIKVVDLVVAIKEAASVVAINQIHLISEILAACKAGMAGVEELPGGISHPMGRVVVCLVGILVGLAGHTVVTVVAGELVVEISKTFPAFRRCILRLVFHVQTKKG